MGDPRTETTLNLEEIYAIHFQFDPDDEVADFYLDDLEIY
jgi:hypothetical protein